MRTVLANPVNCFETFNAGINAKSSTNAINHIIYTNKSGALIEKFKNNTSDPSVRYGQGKIKIMDYSLSHNSGDVDVDTENTTHLIVRFDRGKAVKPQYANKQIKLYVEVDGSDNITACRAIASGSDLIWGRSNSNANDIYYNTGLVGVGTDDPKTTLDVTGEVKVGNSGATCNSDSEGALRYASQSLELCNGSDWIKVGGGSPILAKGNAVNSNSTNGVITINRTINLTEPGVLSVNANTIRYYGSGGGVNSGAMITIRVNGAFCAEDINFEGESSTITFRASASCIIALSAGSHQIRVQSRNNASTPNAHIRTRMGYMVIRDN